MRNPWLKEQLLNDSEVEVPAVTPEESELGQDIRKLQLEYPEETPEEKAQRLSIQDRIDRVVLVGYGVVVAVSVIICAAGMLIFDSDALVALFTISFLQGPFVMYQRIQLNRTRARREAVATLWTEIRSMKQLNDNVEADISTMDEDVKRLKASMGRYASMIKGYDISGVTDLYHENERINEQIKLLAEAMGIEKLTQCILRTDVNRNHFVGDAELTLLAHRVELIEGVPFTCEELCDRYKLEDVRTLRSLTDVVHSLYIEKRREQVAKEAAEGSEKGPKNLGTPFLWKRKISAIGISV